jgi:uncharacterized protein (TIGR02246 family)
MRNRRWGLVVLVAALALGGLALGGAFRRQEEEKPRPGGKLTPEAVRAEEKAIRQAVAGFSAAFNKGDLDALMAYWSPEGEYVNETGKSYRGKSQLRALLKKALAAARGQKHSINITSIRFLKPDVAQEEGTTTLAPADGNIDRGRYTALWLKHDGKWLLGCVRDLPDAAEEDRPAAYQRLRPLSWMVGEWQEKDGGATFSVRWAPGQAYLLMSWTVKRGEESLQVEQRVGWDPANGRLRSWLFDTTGGFGEGTWERQGNTWVVRNEGTYPDGKAARSVNTWKFVNHDTFEWAARERQADEMPLPDAEAVYTRKNPTKGAGK